MSLTPSTRLGHYEIVAPLGAGGMGEVYRARDSRLGRDVAIKVLSAAAAADAGLLQRLQQEARTIAALNHPSLLAIYDLGEYQGAPFLVMELLEGETLRARLARGPLPVRRAIEVARHIAQGLAAAHESGVIHRDLKPENIFLTPDGRAKILDFGLAKTTATAAGAELGEAATLAGTVPGTGATLPGMVLGTAGYMAPEQVRGEAATPRSDIFAFGAVLYEMLTAHRAFGAGSSIEVMSAILRDEPPEAIVQGAPLPPVLDRIVRRCLEKEPRQRFQTAADLDFALAALDSASSLSTLSTAQPALAAPAAHGTRRWPTGPLAAVLAFVLGGALVALFTVGRGAPDPTAARMLPVAPEIASGSTGHWSPDGAAVAFAASSGPGQLPQVFVRYLNAPTATQLTHIPDLNDVQGWSPTGDRILYYDGRRIWSVSAVGGAPQAVYDFGPRVDLRALTNAGPLWATLRIGADGRFGVQTAARLGAPWVPYRPAPFAATTIINIADLEVAPDRRQILLTLDSERGHEEVWLLPYPADPGHPPRQILRRLGIQGAAPTFSWMPDSRHLVMAMQPNPTAKRQLWLVDSQSGAVRPLTFGLGAYGLPAVSADGSGLLFVHAQGDFDIVAVRLDTAVATPLIAQSTSDDEPAWALRQPAMVYMSDRDGPREIWLHTVAANGDTAERPLVTPQDFGHGGSTGFVAPVLSPSADRLLFTTITPGAGTIKLWISSTAGGKPVPLTTGDARLEVAAAWSPDGNTAAFMGIQGDNGALMVAPTSGGATATTLRPDILPMVPVWSPDGRWIAYENADQTVHLVSPDGKQDRSLGKLDTAAVAFSPDSRLLYGINSVPGHNYLFQVDLSTGAQRRIGDIGPDFTPQTASTPSVRFTLTPDGKSLAFSIARLHQSLWLMRGFDPPPTGLARLRALLHLP